MTCRIMRALLRFFSPPGVRLGWRVLIIPCRMQSVRPVLRRDTRDSRDSARRRRIYCDATPSTNKIGQFIAAPCAVLLMLHIINFCLV